MSGTETLETVGTIPGLEDSVEVDVWSSWDVTFRDVVILDTSNQFYASYNLSTYSLAVPDNYTALKNLLLEAAGLSLP